MSRHTRRTSRQCRCDPWRFTALDEALVQTDVRRSAPIRRGPPAGRRSTPRAVPAVVASGGLGHAQRKSTRVRLVLCGLPTLTLNLKRARTYAERMFRHIVIGHLERGDVWDALGIPLAAAAGAFELPLLGEIVEQTGGYPYFLQFFGSFLCSRVGRPTSDSRTISPSSDACSTSSISRSSRTAISVAGPPANACWRRWPVWRPHQRAEPSSSLDLPNVDVVVRRLVDRGLSIGRPGTYDFALPLFGSYLRRRAELTN